MGGGPGGEGLSLGNPGGHSLGLSSGGGPSGSSGGCVGPSERVLEGFMREGGGFFGGSLDRPGEGFPEDHPSRGRRGGGCPPGDP